MVGGAARPRRAKAPKDVTGTKSNPAIPYTSRIVKPAPVGGALVGGKVKAKRAPSAYNQHIKRYAKAHPGPDLMARAAKEWRKMQGKRRPVKRGGQLVLE